MSTGDGIVDKDDREHRNEMRDRGLLPKVAPPAPTSADYIRCGHCGGLFKNVIEHIETWHKASTNERELRELSVRHKDEILLKRLIFELERLLARMGQEQLSRLDEHLRWPHDKLKCLRCIELGNEQAVKANAARLRQLTGEERP